jgi:hypothetical protein
MGEADGRFRSGRPLDGEFAAYAKADIDHVAGDDAIEALTVQRALTLALLEPLGEARARGLNLRFG